MDSERARLSIRLRDDSGDTVVFVNATLDTLLRDLVAEVLRRLRIPEPPSEWALAYGGVSLPLDMLLGSLCERFTEPSDATAAIELAITRCDSVYKAVAQDHRSVDFPQTVAMPDHQPNDLSDETVDEDCCTSNDEFDLGLSLEDGDAADSSGSAMPKELDDLAEHAGEFELGGLAESADAATERRPVTRQSAVRYFSKMNPERVYPLLVTITERRVEKARIVGVRQATGAEFQMQLAVPIEIEPIIPGCECYPQRITAIAGKGDLSARFHVVPSAVGRIDGATVVIRQSHAILSQVPLEVTVIPQTHAIMSAAMTFAAPSLSAAMDHFGLDFEALPGQGNLYLSAAHLLFDQISPLTLTLALGGVTAALAWHAWPRSKEVFWEVQARSPAERLQSIAASGRVDSASSYRDLVDLVQDSPELLPARLLKARLDRHADRDKAAMDEYLAAFKLGAASVDDYQSAYELARKQSDPRLILSVLQCADQSLAPHAMPSRMIYNLACFQARCGQEDDAMRSLRRAFAAGYNKINRARTDIDLRKLWSRDDFEALLQRASRREVDPEPS